MTATLNGLGYGRDLIDAALRNAVARLDPDTGLVVSYHLGWCDPQGNPLTGNGGKAIRPIMTLLAARACGAADTAALPGAVAVELVHNFSLVHDDLMDRDRERRHRATVWAVWGDATAVLAGDMMLSLAHDVLLESDSPHAAPAGRVIAAATRDLIRGQAQDIAFERRNDVGLQECLDMAFGKTGALLGASSAVGAVLAGADEPTVAAMSDYGRHVGLAFQLVDDVLGIWGEPEITGKPVYSDLRSHKKSLPITWTLEQDDTTASELREWLAAEPDSMVTESELRSVATLIDHSGARDWTLAEARRRVELAQRALDSIDLLTTPRAALCDLAQYIVDREA
ncbi:polyprenyl synthetase family protein [Aldersonia kunmingensis]|uniref:polyprenyl synthetase family protein n=1 Tax=Aldersonia kunmingensis TaxID=408066 RepID=UPI00082DF223|nr:polyprenyl synthetase family protein [Aldersonia kunmingensis]